MDKYVGDNQLWATGYTGAAALPVCERAFFAVPWEPTPLSPWQRRAPSGTQRPALLDKRPRRAALTTRFIF